MRRVHVLLLAVLLSGGATLRSPSCGGVPTNVFCSGVTYEASLPLPAVELDLAARSDYEAATAKLLQRASSAGMPMCLGAWKSLQCASKFQRCSGDLSTPHRVCRSLCVQFANACNGSEAVLSRCSDNLLYDEPPCTDYAEVIVSPWEQANSRLASSPAELFHTASGIPLILTLLVLALHAGCCALQYACGSRLDEPEESPRDEVREALRRQEAAQAVTKNGNQAY